MNKFIAKNHYLWVPGFITKPRAKKLAQQFLADSVEFSSDTQCPGSPSKHDYLPFVELLCEKVPEVSELLGEPVLPTYAYARAYTKGAILHAHKDRPSCEISLTLNLATDAMWPIYMELPSGKEAVELKLKPGDAALYLGCDTTHWRHEFKGTGCVQVFLHYVRSRGPYADHYFDLKQRFSPDGTQQKRN